MTIRETVLHYRILEELRGGGMGVVYIAEDTKLHRTVVLKFLSDRLESDPRAVALFHNEARLVSALSHPNICTVYGTEEFDDRHFIAMEYVEGKTLKQFVAGRPLDLHVLLALAVQIADALDCIHARGILHCDIKPSNIKVTPQAQIKLLDFGIAKRDLGKTAGNLIAHRAPEHDGFRVPGGTVGAWMGTMGYMSPEQTLGKKLDPRSDLFAFGAVLYEMCTGAPAFTGATDAAISDAVLHKSPIPPSRLAPEIPPGLERIIAKSLQKNRDTRYQSAADLRGDIRRLQREVDSENPTEWGIPPARPRRFSRRTLLELTGLSMVILAFVLVSYLRRSSPIDAGLRMSQLTANSPEMAVLAAALSPDGKSLAYADASGLYVQVVSSGESHALAVPGCPTVSSISWYPDQDKLLLTCTDRGDPSSLWTLSVFEGKLLKVRDGAVSGVVSPDASRIAFLSDTGRDILTMGINGEDTQLLCHAPNGSAFRDPFWFADGGRLLYAIDTYGPSPSSRLESRDVGGSDAREILSDSTMETHFLLPDGRLVYAVPARPPSPRTSVLYAMRLDATGKVAQSPERIASLPASAVVGITGSSDGRRLAVLKSPTQADVYIAKVVNDGRSIDEPWRLTLNERDDFPLAWTLDGKAVLFLSNRGGQWDVFKQVLLDRTASRVAANLEDLSSAQLSPSGDSVLYRPRTSATSKSSPNPTTLLRMPLSGGAPQDSVSLGTLDGTIGVSCASSLSSLCAVATTSANELVFYSLFGAAGRETAIARLKYANPNLPAWSVSLDGSRIAVAIPAGSGETIHILDLLSQVQKEIRVEGRFGFQSLHWSANGRGLYASDRTYGGSDLLYIDLDGSVSPMRHQQANSQIHAIPSLDGAQLAFTEWTAANNVWIIDSF